MFLLGFNLIPRYISYCFSFFLINHVVQYIPKAVGICVWLYPVSTMIYTLSDSLIAFPMGHLKQIRIEGGSLSESVMGMITCKFIQKQIWIQLGHPCLSSDVGICAGSNHLNLLYTFVLIRMCFENGNCTRVKSHQLCWLCNTQSKILHVIMLHPVWKLFMGTWMVMGI